MLSRVDVQVDFPGAVLLVDLHREPGLFASAIWRGSISARLAWPERTRIQPRARRPRRNDVRSAAGRPVAAAPIAVVADPSMVRDIRLERATLNGPAPIGFSVAPNAPSVSDGRADHHAGLAPSRYGIWPFGAFSFSRTISSPSRFDARRSAIIVFDVAKPARVPERLGPLEILRDRGGIEFRAIMEGHAVPQLQGHFGQVRIVFPGLREARLRDRLPRRAGPASS